MAIGRATIRVRQLRNLGRSSLAAALIAARCAGMERIGRVWEFKAWLVLDRHLPTDIRGKDRVDDRRVISGIRAMYSRLARRGTQGYA